MAKKLAMSLLALASVWLSYWVSAFFGGGNTTSWREILPGVFRSAGQPAGYALIENGHTILIDAPADADLSALKNHGGKHIDFVLLTHHHRDTCWQARQLVKAGITVRGPKSSAPWLTPRGVEQYWQQALPLRTSRTAYLVLPCGIDGLDLSVDDGQVLSWQDWEIRVLSTPGHSPDHVCYLAKRRGEKSSIVFCGDCLAGPGKLWTPYTTDWDHWTDTGLKRAAESLRLIAPNQVKALLPAHGEPILEGALDALELTAKLIEKAAQLKSFECYTKEITGRPPQYRFLAPEQSATAGEKPWSQLSPHLYLTGNTYVLASHSGGILVVDPWGRRSAEQIARLQRDKQLGPVEVVMISHAHYDHYDGLFELPEYQHCQVWTLDIVAEPLREPLRLRHPFLDARPVRITHTPKSGDLLRWREYSFRFYHLPGQTYYTMGVETVIDEKRCLFTGDNWFHHDQYSGSGGWMGLNRGLPDGYAASARRVLEIAPDWILAEHGSAMEYNAQDFRRRLNWAQAAMAVADALSVSGDHRRDWNPHRIAVVPLVVTCRAGGQAQCQFVVENLSPMLEVLNVEWYWPWLERPQRHQVVAPPRQTSRHPVSVSIPGHVKPGQYVVPLRILHECHEDGSDAVLVMRVKS